MSEEKVSYTLGPQYNGNNSSYFVLYNMKSRVMRTLIVSTREKDMENFHCVKSAPMQLLWFHIDKLHRNINVKPILNYNYSYENFHYVYNSRFQHVSSKMV